MKKIFSYFKNKWTGYLDRLAKVNQELYGNKRLDCCGLNDEEAADRR